MTYATLGAARQVVFVRRPPGEVDGGTIYDDRLIAALSAAGVRVRAVIAARRSTADTLLAAAAHGTSPRFCRYTWRPDEIADDDYADVIVSHESAMLPVLGLPPSRRVFLIFHNLPTAFDDERRASAGGLFAPLAGPLQRRLLKRHNTIPVLLSAREIAIARREAPGADLRYLPPGMPVHFSLPRTQALPAEFVVAGTYDWSVKQRDALWFRDAVIPALSPSLRQTAIWHVDKQFTPAVRNARALAVLPDDGRIRIGVVPDRFLSGMKLKVLWYIAANCIVAAPRDLLDEFADIPWASEFVLTYRDHRDLERIAGSLAKLDVAQFAAFRHSCLARFDWAAASSVLG